MKRPQAAKTEAKTESPATLDESLGLRLEAIEHLALAESRSDHPACLFLRCGLRGELDAARFDNAVRAALMSHPLLRARVAGNALAPTRKLSWVFDVASAALKLRPHDPGRDPHIDLSKEPGLRLTHERGSQGEVLWVQAHAACTDARGLLRFLEDVFAYYDGKAARLQALKLEAGEARIDPALLHARGQFHMSDAERRSRLISDLLPAFTGWQGSVEELHASPVPAAKTKAGAYCVRQLSEDDLETLRNGAKANGLTLNALLTHELLRTLAHWNAPKRPSAGALSSIRLALATDMRHLGDERLPACNLTSVVMIDRLPAQVDDHDALMQELRVARDQTLGYTRLRLAAFAGRMKGGMQRFLKPSSKGNKAATATLVALEPMRELRSGGLVLESIALLPPLAPLSRASFGVVPYARGATITLHYDATALAASDAESLLASYVQYLAACMVSTEEVKAAFAAKLKGRFAASAEAGTAASRFWSLPIGKNVRPEPSFDAAALPPAGQ